ncbi:MAG: c-type cytochrome [Rhodocyclaceae bacterium]
MKKLLSAAVLGALAASVTLTASAQSTEDMIKFRQSTFSFMNWNMGKIKAQAVDGSVPFDQQQVAAAAGAIAAAANAGLSGLFPQGSDQGSGWKPTRLKSSFFDEPDKVREIAMSFIQEANKLQEVAANGDRSAIASQFGEVGRTCKACHDNYRAPE